MPPDARIAVVTTREKFFRLSVFLEQSPKRCERFYKFQKLFCPKKFQGYVDYEFRKSGKVFRKKLENRSELEKNSEIFSFGKNFSTNCSPGHLLLFCQPWIKIFAIVPKSSKTIQKPSRFQDFLSELLLCNCSSGHVESSFDNPAKKIPLKKHVLLVKVPKRRKTFCSTVNFSSFFLSTLRLLLRHTWLFFCQNQKNLTQSPKKDDNSKNNFCHFFFKILLRTREMPFWQPFHKFFAKSWILSLRDRERSKNYFSLQKNLQTFRWTRRLQFWQRYQTFWHQKWNNFAQQTKSFSKASSFQRNVLKLFLWTRWT